MAMFSLFLTSSELVKVAILKRPGISSVHFGAQQRHNAPPLSCGLKSEMNNSNDVVSLQVCASGAIVNVEGSCVAQRALVGPGLIITISIAFLIWQ